MLGRVAGAWTALVPTSEGFDWGELFLLAYLFHNHFTAMFVDSVGPRARLRTDNLVESAIDELYRAVVLNRDSDATDLLNHASEVLSARDSSGHAVVVGAVYSVYQPQTSHVYVLPFSRVVEGHRIGMPGIKPTDRTCTNAREYRPVFIGRYEKFVDAQAPPNTHHLQGVSAANVDDICR